MSYGPICWINMEGNLHFMEWLRCDLSVRLINWNWIRTRLRPVLGLKLIDEFYYKFLLVRKGNAWKNPQFWWTKPLQSKKLNRRSIGKFNFTNAGRIVW